MLLKVMLNAAGHVRPDAQDFARAPYFDNTQVACLKYLSTLSEKTQENRAVFFKGLPEIIPSMNERILVGVLFFGGVWFSWGLVRATLVCCVIPSTHG